METVLKNAYTEVNQILNLLGDKYKNKVPKELIDLFEEKQNLEYKTNINRNTKVENMKISRTALIIVSILNLKYWATYEEKEKLQKIYNYNEEKFQEKINIYKDKDWLKKQKNNKNNTIVEEKSITVQTKISIVEKIKNFFRNIFQKK